MNLVYFTSSKTAPYSTCATTDTGEIISVKAFCLTTNPMDGFVNIRNNKIVISNLKCFIAIIFKTSHLSLVNMAVKLYKK